MENQKKEMKPFGVCPVCGGDLRKKNVEKLIRGGGDIVSLKVSADVCLHCGERLYSEDIVQTFEEIRTKLEKKDRSYLKIMGQSFTVTNDWPNKEIQPTATTNM